MQQTYSNLCLVGLISLTLLVTGKHLLDCSVASIQHSSPPGTWSSPILRRSAVEVEQLPEAEQPSHCRQSKPKSTSQCPEELKERRYFFHELKGCKKYGICREDAAEYDNQTEVNFYQNFDDCQVECMQRE